MAQREDSGLGPTESTKKAKGTPYKTPKANREPVGPTGDFKRGPSYYDDRDLGATDSHGTDAPLVGKAPKPVTAPTDPGYLDNPTSPQSASTGLAFTPNPITGQQDAPPINPASGEPQLGNPGAVTTTSSVRDEVRRSALANGVPTAIALAVAQHASGLNQSRVSKSGRVGVMGVQPQAEGTHSVYDWRDNIQLGMAALRHAYEQTGSWQAAVKEYGLNPGSVAATAHKISRGADVPKGFTGNVRVAAPLPGNPDFGNGYGYRGVSGEQEFHPGVDLIAPNGTPVRAMVGGKVTAAGDTNASPGSHVVVTDMQGRKWGYFHLAEGPAVKVGASVKPGDRLGTVGATGVTTGDRLFIQLQTGKTWQNPTTVVKSAFSKPGAHTIQISDSDFHDGADYSGLPANVNQPSTNLPQGQVPPGVANIPHPQTGGPLVPASPAQDRVNDQMNAASEIGPTSPELQNLQKRQQIFATGGV